MDGLAGLRSEAEGVERKEGSEVLIVGRNAGGILILTEIEVRGRS